MVPIFLRILTKKMICKNGIIMHLDLFSFYIQYSLEENIYITIALLTITPPFPPPQTGFQIYAIRQGTYEYTVRKIHY